MTSAIYLHIQDYKAQTSISCTWDWLSLPPRQPKLQSGTWMVALRAWVWRRPTNELSVRIPAKRLTQTKANIRRWGVYCFVCKETTAHVTRSKRTQLVTLGYTPRLPDQRYVEAIFGIDDEQIWEAEKLNPWLKEPVWWCSSATAARMNFKLVYWNHFNHRTHGFLFRNTWFHHLRCIKDLQGHIQQIDNQYDLCNEAWAKGEAENFYGNEFLHCTRGTAVFDVRDLTSLQIGYSNSMYIQVFFRLCLPSFHPMTKWIQVSHLGWATHEECYLCVLALAKYLKYRASDILFFFNLFISLFPLGAARHLRQSSKFGFFDPIKIVYLQRLLPNRNQLLLKYKNDILSMFGSGMRRSTMRRRKLLKRRRNQRGRNRLRLQLPSRLLHLLKAERRRLRIKTRSRHNTLLLLVQFPGKLESQLPSVDVEAFIFEVPAGWTSIQQTVNVNWTFAIIVVHVFKYLH